MEPYIIGVTEGSFIMMKIHINTINKKAESPCQLEALGEEREGVKMKGRKEVNNSTQTKYCEPKKANPGVRLSAWRC
jgi:hypothetical protein